VYVRKFESHVQIANRCAPWKISNGEGNFVLHELQFQYIVVCRKLPARTTVESVLICTEAYIVSRRSHKKHVFLYCCIYRALHSNGNYPTVTCLFIVAYCSRLYLVNGLLTQNLSLREGVYRAVA
jgi:hypothetical protein